ncbi:MAG: NAD(P)/FAD-dependent oxidoreductase [Candidatus Methanoplasma sp.]|jgi:NADH oxidase (H2O2-forming)|nr:NAD(P)/FAD-dependent oxidoreductase [Candidatus Methanoplasma sp.]
MALRIIVIGSGAAGMTAASAARSADPAAEITLFTEDEHVSYSPCVIPWAIEGKVSWEGMVMHAPEYYARERNIKIFTKTAATVDGDAKKVSAGGREYEYDSLVIAAGSKPFLPPIPGAGLDGVFTVKTVGDGKRIQKAVGSTDRVAIAGAGVIGLEIAAGLAGMGKKVTVIEMMDQAIPRIADRDMADPVQRRLEEMGVEFAMSAPVQSVSGEGSVSGIVAGGREYPCGAVIFATGVRACLDIPKAMGLDIGILGGVAVSPTLQPYKKGRLVPGVYLAGDLVQCESAAVPGPTMSQLGSTAVRQGAVAGRNAAGGRETFGPVASPWVSVIGGKHIAGAGISTGLASWYGVDVVSGKATGLTRARYYPGAGELTVKVLAERSSRRIIGAQILADEDATGRIDWLASAIAAGASADGFLARSENAYCPPTSMVRDVVVSAVEDLVANLGA